MKHVVFSLILLICFFSSALIRAQTCNQARMDSLVMLLQIQAETKVALAGEPLNKTFYTDEFLFYICGQKRKISSLTEQDFTVYLKEYEQLRFTSQTDESIKIIRKK